MKKSEADLAETKALFRKCIPLFDALGDQTRQQILLMLSADESLNVSQIAERLPQSRPAISHHLRILRDVGVLNVTRKGTENYYELAWDEPLGMWKNLIQRLEEQR